MILSSSFAQLSYAIFYFLSRDKSLNFDIVFILAINSFLNMKNGLLTLAILKELFFIVITFGFYLRFFEIFFEEAFMGTLDFGFNFFYNLSNIEFEAVFRFKTFLI